MMSARFLMVLLGTLFWEFSCSGQADGVADAGQKDALRTTDPENTDAPGESDRDTDSGTSPRVDIDTGSDTTSETGMSADADTDTDTDADGDSDTDTDVETDADTSGDADSDTDTDSDANVDTGMKRTLFPKETIWYQKRTTEPAHAESDAIISWMSEEGNSFGAGGRFRITLSFNILTADEGTPFRSFTKNGSFYEGTCDDGDVPIPQGGAIEDHPDYACTGGDCHLLVVHRPSNLLFEMFVANIPDGTFDGAVFEGGCLSVWDMTRDYGWHLVNGLDYERLGRGFDCTSADAAGFPITPLVFTADELASGEINHALRFTLPNANIRDTIYVAPATHSTSATSGPATAPPYGAQLRLRPMVELRANHPGVDFDSLPQGARAIITALQNFGMFLSDGGSIALTGATDQYTTAKYCDHERYEWCDEDPDRLLHEHDIDFIHINDFEVLDNGQTLYTYTGDCELYYFYDSDNRRVVEN